MAAVQHRADVSRSRFNRLLTLAAHPMTPDAPFVTQTRAGDYHDELVLLSAVKAL